MIVLKSTFDRVEARAKVAEAAYSKLVKEWNEMVEQYNRHLRELKRLRPLANKPSPTFSQEEIQKLILLCHPDKHNGKQMAVELTQKLIKLRN